MRQFPPGFQTGTGFCRLSASDSRYRRLFLRENHHRLPIPATGISRLWMFWKFPGNLCYTSRGLLKHRNILFSE
jgi:hypothetical protein